MFKIGITGSIGTGKSTVANMFAIFNLPIFDADKEIKKILNKGEVKKRLKDTWPLIFKNNKINKNKLKAIIFSNIAEKRRLETLLYPYLEIEKAEFEKKNFEKNILIYDVPLIFETRSEKNYDLILLTNCNVNLQRRRVIKRDKISNELFEKIVKTQLSFEDKNKFNPKVINTDKIKLFVLIKIIVLLIKTQIGIKIKKWKKKEH